MPIQLNRSATRSSASATHGNCAGGLSRAKSGIWSLISPKAFAGRSREAQVPAICELYNINYTFSDPLVCAATLDKAVTKRLVRDAGLHTAPFAVVNELDDLKTVKLDFPLFAKPLAEGTGKGITASSKISSAAELQRCMS